MKKLLLLVIMLVMIPVMSYAADPTIRSDSSTFNPLTGVYSLQGNVFVQFPAHDKTLTITGDETQVSIYQLEVHGQGNISLSYDDLTFFCDKVDVYHNQRIAYVTGNLKFTHDHLLITADSGTFSWKTKLASFHGNVTVNGTKQSGDIVYDVLQKKFI